MKLVHYTCGGTKGAAWRALAQGEIDVHLEDEAYVLKERNRPRTALTRTEIAVLFEAAHARQGKEIAYALGIAPSTVSTSLGTASMKLGLSTTELVRLVRALVIDDTTTSDRPLSEAEREVLALVLAGKSNAEIAQARQRSVRTIANQVASILKKTNSPSRHVLRVTH